MCPLEIETIAYYKPIDPPGGMLQPHFEGSLRSPLTLPKMGLGSLPRLPKTQNAIAGVKTPRIEVFFIPLKSS